MDTALSIIEILRIKILLKIYIPSKVSDDRSKSIQIIILKSLLLFKEKNILCSWIQISV